MGVRGPKEMMPCRRREVTSVVAPIPGQTPKETRTYEGKGKLKRVR